MATGIELQSDPPSTPAGFTAPGPVPVGRVIPMPPDGVGFRIKRKLLGKALHSNELEGFPHLLHYVYYVGLAAALCTAFYMTRLYWLTFEGDRAPDARIPHAHESDSTMTGVILVLAALSIAAAVHGIPFMDNVKAGGPKQTLMENFLSPVFATSQSLIGRTANVKLPSLEEQMHLPITGWLTAWALALLGGATAFVLYGR